jgi:hypothetical protein
MLGKKTLALAKGTDTAECWCGGLSAGARKDAGKSFTEVMPSTFARQFPDTALSQTTMMPEIRPLRLECYH